MRTTLTLDADVARLLDERVHRTRRTFKDVVNDALRVGLSSGTTRRSRKRYRVVPHVTELVSGVDRGALNRLADELEEAESAVKLTKRRRA